MIGVDLGDKEIVEVGVDLNSTLQEELENLYMKYGLQGLIATYISKDNKIKVTSFGKERDYLAYVTNKHINGEGND